MWIFQQATGMLDPPSKLLGWLALLGLLAAASTSKGTSIEEGFDLDDYDDSSNEISPEKFTCEGKPYGYYADQAQDCKVFHICSPIEGSSGRHVKTFDYSFNCPETTIFSQDSRTCISEQYALPCRRAHTLYSLNKSLGQVTPKGARKHVPGSSFNSNLLANNVIPEGSGVFQKPNVPPVVSHRFSSGISTSTQKPVSPAVVNRGNAISKVTSIKDTSKDKNLDLDNKNGSKDGTKSDDSVKKSDEAFDRQKSVNQSEEHSISKSVDRGNIRNRVIQRDENVHQSILSSQKTPKEENESISKNKDSTDGKPNPSFNFKASLGEDNKIPELPSSSRGSSPHHVTSKPAVRGSNKESKSAPIHQLPSVADDRSSLNQNTGSPEKPTTGQSHVKISSNNQISIPKTVSADLRNKNQFDAIKNRQNSSSSSSANQDKQSEMIKNELSDFSDYEISDPELEAIYDEITEFQPKVAEQEFDSGYGDNWEVQSENGSHLTNMENKQKSKPPVLRGGPSEKILPPPPIANSLHNHNVLLTNIRARHNETSKIIKVEKAFVQEKDDNISEVKEVIKNTITIHPSTKSPNHLSNNAQRSSNQFRGRDSSLAVGAIVNHADKGENKQAKITRPSNIVRTTTPPRTTTTTESPYPRNWTTTTIRPISSERGSKRFVPSSLIRQNSNLDATQIGQINQITQNLVNDKENVKINIQRPIPAQSLNQALPLTSTTQRSRVILTTPNFKDLLQTPSHKHTSNKKLSDGEIVTTFSYEIPQTTTEINENDFEDTTEKINVPDIKEIHTKEKPKFETLKITEKLDEVPVKSPIAKINSEGSERTNGQNGKVRKITRTRISPVSQTVQKSGHEVETNTSLNIKNPQNDIEQRRGKVAVDSSSFRKTSELKSSDLASTSEPSDNETFSDQRKNKIVAIESTSFRNTNTRNRVAGVSGGPLNGNEQISNILNNDRSSFDNYSTLTNEGKIETNGKQNDLTYEVAVSSVSSRRRVSSRNRGSSAFQSASPQISNQSRNNAKSIESTNVNQLPAIDTNFARTNNLNDGATTKAPKRKVLSNNINNNTEIRNPANQVSNRKRIVSNPSTSAITQDTQKLQRLPNITVTDNSVRQIPSKTIIDANSKTVIISNINLLPSSTSTGTLEDKLITNNTESDVSQIPTRRRIVTSSPTSNTNAQRGRKTKQSDGTNLTIKVVDKSSTLKSANSTNLGARTTLLPKIQGKLNLQQLTDIEKQIQKFASFNGAQLISYTVKKNDKHPKNIGQTIEKSKNVTLSKKLESGNSGLASDLTKTNAGTNHNLKSSDLASFDTVSSTVPSVGGRRRVNSKVKVQTLKVQPSSNNSRGPSDDVDNFQITNGPLLTSLSNSDEPRKYLPTKKQTNVQQTLTQTSDLQSHPVGATKDIVPETRGVGLSQTLNVDIPRNRVVSENAKKPVPVKDQSNARTVTNVAAKHVRSNNEIKKVSAVQIPEVELELPTTTTIRTSSRSRSRGRTNTAKRIADDVSAANGVLVIKKNETELNEVLQNENNLKESTLQLNNTSKEPSNTGVKNSRASNLEKIRNRVSAIQKKIPGNVDDRDLVIPIESNVAGARGPVNLLNSIKNIKSQRKRLKGGNVESSSKLLVNEPVETEIKESNEFKSANEDQANIADSQNGIVAAIPKPSLSSLRSQIKIQGRSRERHAGIETINKNSELVEQNKDIESERKVSTDDSQTETGGITERTANSQINRSGRQRSRISNTNQNSKPNVETVSLANKELEVLNEEISKKNPPAEPVNLKNTQSRRTTSARKPLATVTLPETETKLSSKPQVDKERENSVATKNLSNSVVAEKFSGSSIRRINRKKITSPNAATTQNSESNLRTDTPNLLIKLNDTTQDVKNSASKKLATSSAIIPASNSAQSRKHLLPRTQANLLTATNTDEEVDSNIDIFHKGNDNLKKLITTEEPVNAARIVSRKRVTSKKPAATVTNLPFPNKINVTKTDEPKQVTAKAPSNTVTQKKTIRVDGKVGTGAVVEKLPGNSSRRVSRKQVTSQATSAASNTTSSRGKAVEIKPARVAEKDETSKLVNQVRRAKVSPSILDSFTSTTEKPQGDLKNPSSRGREKFREDSSKSESAAEDLNFAIDLLEDLNGNQNQSKDAQQYSLSFTTESEPNSKKRVLKKVSPARQFRQKGAEGAEESAEVFSGLKLRVVGTSVKSSVSSLSKEGEKKLNFDLLAASSRTNSHTLSDLELDALRSLTQVNEPLRQSGRLRSSNRRPISKRKV